MNHDADPSHARGERIGRLGPLPAPSSDLLPGRDSLGLNSLTADTAGAVADLLAAGTDPSRRAVAEDLVNQLPWRTEFSPADQEQMTEELVAAAADSDQDHLERVLHEWQNTAIAISDPEIRAAFDRPLEPGLPVPRPEL